MRWIFAASSVPGLAIHCALGIPHGVGRSSILNSARRIRVYPPDSGAVDRVVLPLTQGNHFDDVVDEAKDNSETQWPDAGQIKPQSAQASQVSAYTPLAELLAGLVAGGQVVDRG